MFMSSGNVFPGGSFMKIIFFFTSVLKAFRFVSGVKKQPLWNKFFTPVVFFSVAGEDENGRRGGCEDFQLWIAKRHKLSNSKMNFFCGEKYRARSNRDILGSCYMYSAVAGNLGRSPQLEEE